MCHNFRLRGTQSWKKAQNCMIFMIFAIFDQFWFFLSRAKFWNLISNPIIYTLPTNIHHIPALQAQKISWGLTLRFAVFDNFFRFLLKMTFKQVQLFLWPIKIFNFLTPFLKCTQRLLPELYLTFSTICRIWVDKITWNNRILPKFTYQKTSNYDVIMTS